MTSGGGDAPRVTVREVLARKQRGERLVEDVLADGQRLGDLPHLGDDQRADVTWQRREDAEFRQ